MTADLATEIVHYQADGLAMEGTLYRDPRASGAKPGVLVFPEAFGLGAYARSRAEQLARLGYVALACDLHGEARTFDLAAVMAMIEPLMADPPRIRARARAAFEALAARPEVVAGRVAAIGYCFGGTMALELARDGAAIAGVVGFHSGLSTVTPDASAITGKVLMCVGADDPAIDAAQRAAFEAEMRAARVDWRMHVYGGVVHGFTNPAADALGQPGLARYDSGADARSWREMRSFLDEVLAPAPI